jgi:Kdo2-lipid IVA lauroyltransferase/acyltransferase
MKRRTKSLENWSTRQSVSVLLRLLRWMPDAAIRPFGTALASVGYRSLPRQREIARVNLNHAFGDTLSPQEIDDLVWRSFWHLGQTLVEFLRMAYWDRATIERRVHARNIEPLKTAFSQGRGVILVSAHYGNWELAAARLACAGFPLRVVARETDDAAVGALLNRIRRSAGYEVISRGQGMREALACLQRNEVLTVLLDQNTVQGEVYVDFFGRPAATASGPAVLARRTGAPLVPGFIRRLPDGRHEGEVLPPVEWERTDDPKRDVWEITQRLTAAIEAWVRVDPAQWLWIHDRWKRQPQAPQPAPAPAL